MKKIILILLVIFIFCSCSMDMYESHFNSLTIKHKLYMNSDLSHFTTYVEIAEYLDAQIEYKSGDTWSNPETTFNRGYGNCNDYALAFMNTAYLSMGIKMDLVFVNFRDLLSLDGVDLSKCNLNRQAPRKIEGEFDYAMVRYNGVLILPVTGSLYTGAVYYSFSFDEVFNY